MEQKVKCPNCGSENRPGQQFCGACGTKMGVEAEQQRIKCPSCGAQNLAGQQFCGTCGAGLAAVAQQVPAGGNKEVSTGVTQEMPARVVRPTTAREQIEIKPTWGLAWGLWWRMLLLVLLIGGIVYLIALIVMLAVGFQLPQI